MIDEERRRLYGRPEPGAEPPAMTPPRPAPEQEPAGGGDTEPSPAAPVLEAPAPASRRRRVIAASVVGGIAAASIIGVASVVLGPAAAPSLAVFDREPTEQERGVEERLSTQGSLFIPGAAVQARLVLELPDTAQTTAREIWALRSDLSDQLENPYAVVCLATGPIEQSWSTIGCMDEKDVARRGFIPIDQPRPTLLVDGEQRAVEWGPTGDARLIDVPTPPRDDEGS
ncbi:hypothetical protein [Yonghaparkia sp. Root332]|uniref:hypothetical protein n=1 Tax=Yonghaparkia sp. Root332 TaxID=1736516 RepID=UPI0006F48E95|nr:hypothetical protein [Yonghaparkia sp. Root332]KQV25237.1 hypothetical protein ASC54_12430 [Yonghaparkia sp. Root332]